LPKLINTRTIYRLESKSLYFWSIANFSPSLNISTSRLSRFHFRHSSIALLIIPLVRLLDHADTDRSNLDFIADQTNEVFEAAVREARQQIDEHVDRVGLKESPMAKLNAPEPPRLREYKSPIYCEHANEAPVVCPCDSDCYCKTSSCKKVD